MAIVIGLLALLVAATIASCAWGFGFGKGYELGVKHGRETAEAELPTTHVRTFRMEAGGLESRRALLARMDRTRRGTFGGQS
jgi:alkylhydroperoxidase family enzyme